MARPVRVLNYGGGTNSTALAIECFRRGIELDVLVFADTGSEMPHTYAFLDVFREWLRANELPELMVVRWVRTKAPHAGRFIPLHQWCESDDRVPSRAYGLSGCTVKWKQQPADAAIASHPLVVAEHAAGRPVERLIGYDADEPQRALRMTDKNPNPEKWSWRSPLLDWDMGRDECVAVIESAGLALPGKSACWMCPSMKKREILELQRAHPELLRRAVAMEARAVEAGNLGVGGSRRGLGGSLNWSEFLRTGEGVEPEDAACGCYDGETVQLRLPLKDQQERID